MRAKSTNLVLAANLRRLRESRGWSQEHCAELCNLHRTYIGAVERGERNVTLDTLDKIARAFGLSGIDLLAHK
jgi:Predicted transcriptional regulators